MFLTLYLIYQVTGKNQASKEMYTLAVQPFDIPGDPGFPLNNMYSKPQNRQEAGEIVVAALLTSFKMFQR